MWASYNNLSMAENPKWWADYILTNTDNSTRDPMQKSADVNIIHFNIAYCLLALPINLYAALIILSTSKLRNQPKYKIQLYVTVSNLFTILNDIEETVYHFWPSEALCQSYVSTLSLSHVILFYNTFLVLFDRTFAITQLKFYRRMMNSIITNCVSFFSSLILILFINWVYIVGAAPVRCAYNTFHISTLVVTCSVLFLMCCFLFTFIRVKTRSDPEPLAVKIKNWAQDRVNTSPVAAPHQEETDSIIQSVADALDLMEEKKCTRNSTTSLITILFLPFVIIMMSLPSFICLQFLPPDSSTCSPLLTIASYDNKVSSFNALLSPFIVICNVPELFLPPIFNCFKRFRPSPHSTIQRLRNFTTTFV